MNDIIKTVLCIDSIDIINRCVYEDTCKDGDSDAYKCVYVIAQSRQKRKKVRSSHTERDGARI